MYSPTEGDECYVGYDAEEAIDATASGCVDQSTVAWCANGTRAARALRSPLSRSALALPALALSALALPALAPRSRAPAV